jgi:hypothetical protein
MSEVRRLVLGSIHSIDKASAGRRIDEVETPQDAGASWLR